VALDVTDPASVDRTLAEDADRLGPATIVVNNSGVTATRAALDLDPDEWDRIMATNLKGAWLVARTAARQLIDAKAGR
jgi:NAD(P)-dependent dehydrogenase (short-subunit alcohol dehydrogenase family)